MYALAALAAVLVSGKISDVVGRKPVLLGALVALLIGLGVFLIADNMAMLLLARTIHGAAVGSIVVAGAAALLDLRPDHGVRAGQLSGVSFNIGMTVAILGSALLAQYAPHPLRTPYAVVAVVCLVVGIGLVALNEPHTNRTRGPIRIARPAVPEEIRGDFWFSALGAMASWSVLGVLLSLYPSLAAHQTHIDNLVFGGAVVGTTAFAAALAQLAATRVPARYSAIIGDIGMAISLLLTIPVLLTHQWQLVFVAAALLGATFGLGFGGSLRHLSNVVPAGRRRGDDVSVLPAGLQRDGRADAGGGVGGDRVGPGRGVPVVRRHRRCGMSRCRHRRAAQHQGSAYALGWRHAPEARSAGHRRLP